MLVHTKDSSGGGEERRKTKSEKRAGWNIVEVGHWNGQVKWFASVLYFLCIQLNQIINRSKSVIIQKQLSDRRLFKKISCIIQAQIN